MLPATGVWVLLVGASMATASPLAETTSQPVADKATIPAIEHIGVCLDRTASRAELDVSRPTRFVIRAERDIQVVRIGVATKEPEQPRSCTIKVFQLPASDEPNHEGLEHAQQGKPIFSYQRELSATNPVNIVTHAAVPRRMFANWLLSVVPDEESRLPVHIKIAAEALDASRRCGQLMQMRRTYEPDRDPDAVRRTVGYLSDAEVQYWTGFADRRTFLLVWRRVGTKELATLFPGPERRGLIRPGHRLPNGLSLHLSHPPLLPDTGSPAEPSGE